MVRGWGAARDEQIHRQHSPSPTLHLGVAGEGAPGDGTGPHGHHDAGGGERLPALLQRQAHVLGHGPRHQEPVGMPGGSHHLDSEAPQVEDHRAQHIDLSLTSVASPCTHLPELEGATEEPAHLLVQRLG